MMAQRPHEDELAAIKTALSLLSVPSRGRQVRRSQLPSGTDMLIRIAIDPLTAEAVSESLHRDPGQLSEAASFFIEQILLAPGGDSYRTLGASRESTSNVLRQNFVYLCKWVHAAEREGFAGPAYLVRITQAWNNLKTQDRRATYDKTLDSTSGEQAPHDDMKSRLARNGEALKVPVFHKKSLQAARRKMVFQENRRPGLMARLIAFAFNLKV